MAPAAAALIPVNRVSWVTVLGTRESDRMLWVLWAAQEALSGGTLPSWPLLKVSLSHLHQEASKPHTRLIATWHSLLLLLPPGL